MQISPTNNAVTVPDNSSTRFSKAAIAPLVLVAPSSECWAID